jgi:tetratricopeptide (TPR) repeat protein
MRLIAIILIFSLLATASHGQQPTVWNTRNVPPDVIGNITILDSDTSLSTKLGFNEKAFRFYHRNEFDSALAWYDILRQRYPDFWLDNNLYLSALCYLGKTDTAKAEDFLLRCLQADLSHNFPTMDAQPEACRELSTLFTAQHDYRQALNYLDSSKAKKFQPRMSQCGGGLGYLGDIDFACRRAACYMGLERQDSAIFTLLPAAFIRDWYPKTDSASFLRVTRILVPLLDQKYGREKVRSEISQALDHVWEYATDTIATGPLGAKGYHTLDKKAGFDLFGTEIILLQEQLMLPYAATETEKYSDKTDCIQQVRQSCIYRAIFDANAP